MLLTSLKMPIQSHQECLETTAEAACLLQEELFETNRCKENFELHSTSGREDGRMSTISERTEMERSKK